MRATFLQALLVVGAALAAAVVFALVAAPRGAPEARSAPVRMPAETGRSVVDVRPAPGRPDSSPAPVVRAPSTPAAAPKAPARPKPTTRVARPRPRIRVVTVPGVVLTRVAPAKAPAQLVRVKPTKPPAPNRELASVEQPPAEPLPGRETEPMHDGRPHWRPHE